MVIWHWIPREQTLTIHPVPFLCGKRHIDSIFHKRNTQLYPSSHSHTLTHLIINNTQSPTSSSPTMALFNFFFFFSPSFSSSSTLLFPPPMADPLYLLFLPPPFTNPNPFWFHPRRYPLWAFLVCFILFSVFNPRKLFKFFLTLQVQLSIFMGRVCFLHPSNRFGGGV